MIIDDAVFISSFNWNRNSFMRNREAGIMVYNKELARYYEDIFWHDWGKSKIERGTLIMISCLIVAFVSFLVARRFRIIKK
jgi:phosphatidylserine/phosphatidylglycerophosphate/cardiolipin synthase-like enzyme